MKLNIEALQKHLEKKLLPAYFIHGNEPLLSLECIDLIHQRAKALGFNECIKLDALQDDLGLQTLVELTQNYSLFGDKRRIQLTIGEKLQDDIESWLADFLNMLPKMDDSVLIVKAPKLTAAQLKKKWVEQLDGMGAIVTLWEVDREHLPRWLEQRAATKKITLAREALILLTEHVEGNLLAAAQVLEKLAVLRPGGVISQNELLPLLASDARYDVFDLTASVLEGHLDRALKILEQLRHENFEATIILWALSKELRILAELSAAARSEWSRLYQIHKIWDKRQVQYQKALARLHYPKILNLLVMAQKIDLDIKGLGSESPWYALKHLIVECCLKK
jgi:DNA polymerase-3 subunit delta